MWAGCGSIWGRSDDSGRVHALWVGIAIKTKDGKRAKGFWKSIMFGLAHGSIRKTEEVAEPGKDIERFKEETQTKAKQQKWRHIKGNGGRKGSKNIKKFS